MRDAVGRYGTVLVLGGTSDIGLAIARALALRGVRRIVLAGRDAERLERAADRVRGARTTVETAAFDAEDTSSHDAFVHDAFSRGDVDVAVLAFGVLGDQQRDENDVEAALRVARVNYLGSISVGLALARAMREQAHGSIVALSSVAAERGRRANFIYGSSKAGMDAFFHGLGDALTGTGVHVLVVRPGWVATKMTEGRKPAPFATSADDVGDAVARALERGDETIWVPSTLRWVMAVIRHLPRSVFRRIRS